MKLIDVLYFPFPDYLHGHFGGFATYSGGRYRVIIDNRQTEERQRHFLRHEYGHIMLGHIHAAEPEYDTPEYDAREAAADAYAEAMTDAEFSVLLSLSAQVHLDKLPEGLPEVMPA